MASAHFHQVVQLFLAIFTVGTAIRATTTGRMPLKARSTQGLSRKAVKNMATARMMRKEGVMLPRVAATLPLNPRSLCPAKMEMFTAITPGALWDRVNQLMREQKE